MVNRKNFLLLIIFLNLSFFIPHVFAQDPHVSFVPPKAPETIKLMIVGNSITFHEASTKLGWSCNCGMAASNLKNDFSHILMRKLGVSIENSYIRNFYPFEVDYAQSSDLIDSLNDLVYSDKAIVVIQMGDNVPNDSGAIKTFSSSLNKLLNKFTYKNISVYCTSTWWRVPEKDKIIKHTCEANGANYVYIGDIYGSVNNLDRKIRRFEHVGVESHPQNWGMRQIAIRLYNAIKSNEEAAKSFGDHLLDSSKSYMLD